MSSIVSDEVVHNSQPNIEEPEGVELEVSQKRNIMVKVLVVAVAIVPLLLLALLYFMTQSEHCETKKSIDQPFLSCSVESIKKSKLASQSAPAVFSVILSKKNIIIPVSFVLVLIVTVVLALHQTRSFSQTDTVVDTESGTIPTDNTVVQREAEYEESSSWLLWLVGIMVAVLLVAFSVWFWLSKKTIISSTAAKPNGKDMIDNTKEFHPFFSQFRPKDAPHQVTKQNYYAARMLILSVWAYHAYKHPNYNTLTLDENESNILYTASLGLYPGDRPKDPLKFLPTLGKSPNLSEKGFVATLTATTNVLCKVMEMMGMEVEQYPKLAEICSTKLMSVNSDDESQMMMLRLEANVIREDSVDGE